MDNNKGKSESELIGALKRGDIKAFDELYHLYKIRTYYFILKIVKLKEETEGLVQDVFIKLWENRSKINEDETLRLWLFKVAYNLSIDRLRKLSHNKEYIDYLKHSPNNGNLDTEKAVNYSILQEHLEGVISTLPEQRQKIYILSRNEGMSNKEIAEELNISTNTVENQMVSALKVIRKSLQSFRTIFLTFIY